MNRLIGTLLVACIAALALPLAASAAPITTPADLKPGDQYRLAFVTSTERDATSSDLSIYNAFVTSAANTVPELVALGTTWKVIGSTYLDAARDNTGTNPVAPGVPVYNTGAGRVAVSNADLWDGMLMQPINRNEQGEIRFHYRNESVVWTGTYFDGRGDVGSWNFGYPIVTSGWFDATGYDWINRQTYQQRSDYPFYAISGVLTVPPFLMGDANGDGAVGAGDYAIWAAEFGHTGAGLTADFDGNGSVGAGDYALWAANFGKTRGASVPEPSTWGLGVMAVAALTAGRTNSRSSRPGRLRHPG